MQPQLVTSSNTIDKKTLLKASAIMGKDLSSHSTKSFKGFYSNENPSSQPILVSSGKPERTPSAHIDLMQDSDQEETEYVISLTPHKDSQCSGCLSDSNSTTC